MKDELKTILYETVRPNCGTILASAYSKDGKPLASTETSAHTCNFSYRYAGEFKYLR